MSSFQELAQQSSSTAAAAYEPPRSQFIGPVLPKDITPEELATMPFPAAVPGQNFAVISVVAPPGQNTRKTSNTLAIRIYGIFDTEEAAERCINRGKKMGYNFFDMYVVPINEGFIPLPPPTIDPDVRTWYDHPVLHQVMRGHRDIINESAERLLARKHETPSAHVPELKRIERPKEETKGENKENVITLTPLPPIATSANAGQFTPSSSPSLSLEPPASSSSSSQPQEQEQEEDSASSGGLGLP